MSAHSLVPYVHFIHTHIWLKFEPCPHSTHDHHHGHPCGCCLFDLTSSFYLFAFLLSFFLFPFFHLSDEQQPELNKKIMENLRYSATNGGEGTYDVRGDNAQESLDAKMTTRRKSRSLMVRLKKMINGISTFFGNVDNVKIYHQKDLTRR